MSSQSAPTVVPPVVALGCLATQAVLTRGGGGTRDYPGRRMLAGCLAAAAVGLASTGARAVLGAGSTLDPREPGRSTVLVTDGVYAHTRNPMYLGLATLLTGAAAWTGHRRSLFPVAAFVAWIDRRQIPAEEAALRVTFGVDFDNYAGSVRRWI